MSDSGGDSVYHDVPEDVRELLNRMEQTGEPLTREDFKRLAAGRMIDEMTRDELIDWILLLRRRLAQADSKLSPTPSRTESPT